MIVDCAAYELGHRRPGDLSPSEAAQACRREGTFVWLGLHEPTPEEFESVRRDFNLHELAVEDAIKAHQRPKLELYDETMLMVLKPVRYVDPDEVVDVGEILLLVHQSFLISVRHGVAGELGEVRQRVDHRPDLAKLGPTAVLYAIADRLVDGYEAVVDDVSVDLQELEEQVFSSDRSNPVERIYKLEREVLDFDRAVRPLIGPLDRLASGDAGMVPGELQEYFRDVHDHLLRVAQRVDGFRELLSSILQVNLTQVNVRQNEDMRKITAWVAILAVPTMIAGIYGMNFDHMPELRWEFGYPAVLTLILVICALLYTRFRRSGWL